jgi:hypothetical protein
MKSYAGIGSRETPPDILLTFVSIGAFLAKHGYTLRSGGAAGADQAFERGCDLERGAKEIYLPWPRFEDSSSSLVVENSLAFEIAAKHHPRWESLSKGAQKLQARNSHQVLGWTLDDPCDFIICWTKNGKGSGGTGQALRIAKDRGIPVFDAGLYDQVDEVKQAFNEFYKQHR